MTAEVRGCGRMSWSSVAHISSNEKRSFHASALPRWNSRERITTTGPGPETVQVLALKKDLTQVILNLRSIWDIGAQLDTQGNTLLFSRTSKFRHPIGSE